uniref:Acid phosphatase n=1 Tax=Panagrolaimus sp. JU765 TaxID=591449 RepID=A0AC34Q197_9BILA
MQQLFKIFIQVLFINLVFGDKLVDLHLIFRHGERVPERTYPTDPLKDIWTDPPGELTKMGQMHAFTQGLKIKQRYIEDLNYLNKNYWSRDIMVRSTFLNRTLASALIFMTAFYLDSEGTTPDDPRWPKGWNPIPVQTVPFEDEYLLLSFDICKRFKRLAREREFHPKVQQLMLEEKPFLEELAKNASLSVDDYSTYDGFWGFKDAVLIQTLMGLKRASWITKEIWDRFLSTRQKVYYFVKGEAGFGEPENVEMTAIGSGLFLKTLIDDMERKMAGQSSLKLHFYSAHDSTISYVLRALGPKTDVVGYGAPGFASTVAFELWQDDHANHYVKLLYWKNNQTDVESIQQT